MQRLFSILPCAVALNHRPEYWTHGPVDDVARAYGELGRIETGAQYLEVPLDHFAVGKGETWQLKYFVVDTYFQNGGALVLNMPVESPTNGCGASSMVQALGAVTVCSEHRFFGESVPLGLSTVENYQYMSVEQNLADQVALLKHIRSLYPSVSKVVSNGGSYPGASAAWIRHAHPELVDAAVAESSSVFARMGFPQYDTSNLVAVSSPDARCSNALSKTSSAIERQMTTNRSSLYSLFQADYQITSDTGDSDFIYGIGDITAYKVQYGQKAELCSALKPLYGKTLSDVEYSEVFAQFMRQSFGDSYFSGCDYNSTCMRDATHQVPQTTMRPWFWMKCVHLGYFQISPPTGLSTRPRGYTEENALEQCAYIFPGADLLTQAKVDAFNEEFGGVAFGGSSNIFELAYSDDPWKESASVPVVNRQSDLLSEEQPFLYLTCDGCAHCGSGPGVTEGEKRLILEQKVFFLQSWGIPVLGAGFEEAV